MEATDPEPEQRARRARRAKAVESYYVDDAGDGDDDFEELAPRGKRRRSAAVRAAGWRDDQPLIDVVKYNGKVINHAVKRLVEVYEAQPKSAMAEILMMLFEACGSKYHFDMDALDEIDVDDVVLSLVELARNGDMEDYYNSKQKELKNFKENLALFWDNLVLECQNGPLFDRILFDKCMDYVIALSCTPPRVYRQVASLVGLQLVTSFISVAKTLSGLRETTQRQLNAEKKKGGDGPRVESLSKRLAVTHEKITSVEEMMRKMFTGLFMHRYRDVDPDIRMSCISSLGAWIVSYPSLFLQDLYLKYLGWTLNDKIPTIRKASILALQNLYAVDDNVPSLGLFTERFNNRMIELADDIDISVAVSAIGLLKLLLRHQLLSDEDLGPLYDLLIDEPAPIRRAIGELVYDHLIVQNNSTSGSKDGDGEPSEVHIGRLLQILREFSEDPILSAYVIDDIWDDMKAMRDWKCIISMLLDENPLTELTDVDATNLVRLLCTSARRAIGERIVPAVDNRKIYYTKAQKDMFDNNKKELTAAMLKRYPQLLSKYVADKAKVSPLVDMLLLLNLEIYTLKRQEQNFKAVLDLVVDAFFKHGEKDPLRSCMKAINYCAIEGQADLQAYAQTKLKHLEDELVLKVKTALKEVKAGDDEYSLLVNLKRLYEFQLTKPVYGDSLFLDFSQISTQLKDMDSEVKSFLLLNMHLHIVWSVHFIDSENPSEASMNELSSKRRTIFEQLYHLVDVLPSLQSEGKSVMVLSSRVCIIISDLWCLFRESKLASTKLEPLGYLPKADIVQKFWNLCEKHLNVSAETEEEDANEEYIEDTNRDAVSIAAAKLLIFDVVPKDYLGPEIISHLGSYGPNIAEVIKSLIMALKKTAHCDIAALFLEALKRAYQRDTLSMVSKTRSDCKDLGSRLAGIYVGAARSKNKHEILKIVQDGISFAFLDSPKQLSFLEVALLPFVSKLPSVDVVHILKNVEKRTENVNTIEDPSGWKPYYTFIEYLREKCAKNEVLQDEGEEKPVRRRGRPRKDRSAPIPGRRLFDGQISDDDSISDSDQQVGASEDDEADQAMSQTLSAAASKLRSMRATPQESSRDRITSTATGSSR